MGEASIIINLQVLDAERDLFDAELNLAQLQRDEQLNIVGLYRALGFVTSRIDRAYGRTLP